MIGRIFHDRYRIDSEIGQGGMGTVYLGYDKTLERQVAIKVLSRIGLGRDGRAHILNEAQMAAKLNHPNIVTVYDVREDQETPFIVMEYVEGKSLHEARPEPLNETLKIIRQVCGGLEHAHEQGIIHRDLKPENVIITRNGTAKLMDFGLAKSITSRYTSDGLLAGTVFYLAPEQALGQEIDQRTDLYSLGVMIYELTMGDLPFIDQDPIAVISQHLHAPVVPPRAKKDEIPPTLNALILKLMSKDARDRPATASEVLHTLESVELGAQEFDQVEELSVLDRIVRGRMVGRERELSQSRQMWQNAVSGEGQLLLISGEPGIGKTRLMREIATHAEVSGGQVLVGECQEEGNAPYAPFAQITRRALRANGFKLPKQVMADLIALSPELQIDYPEVELNPKLDPEAEQRRLFENLVRFCDILGQDSPLLLVLEDIHWADSGSLHMLEHLARRTRHKPVMLIGTYRELELDEALPLHETLLGLTRKRLGRRLKLDRLNKDATEDMLGVIFAEQIKPDFLEGIYKETEGNPYFVEEISKALVENGEVWFEDGEWQRAPSMDDVIIPQGVKVAIQSRVSKLTEETQGYLLIAGVIGKDFDYQLLKKVTEQNEEILIDCLEEGIRKQLIEEVRGGRGEQFSFSHALIPATLRESISGLRRTRLHRRVATAIEQLHPEEFERLAYHWGEAGDEQKGLAYTIKAADRAKQAYANEDAIRLYTEAITLLAEDDINRFDLLEGRAAVYDVMAEREAQLADVEAMLKLAEDQRDEIRQVDALLNLSSLYLDTEPAKAREPLDQALKIVREIGDKGREGRALYDYGRQAFFMANYSKAQEYFESSAVSLRQADLIGETAESLSFLSVALGFLGERPAALKAAQEAVGLSRETGDKLLEAISTRRLAIAFMNQYRESQALPIAELALQMFREVGDIGNIQATLLALGLIKVRLGLIKPAESDFLDGLKIAETIGNEISIRWLIGHISSVYKWDMGEYTKTLLLIEDHLEKVRRNDNESLEYNLQLHKSYELKYLGSHKSALTLCETILPASQKIMDEEYQVRLLNNMGILSAELGKTDQAYRYLDEAVEICSRLINPIDKTDVDRNNAQVKLMEGGGLKLKMGMEIINGVIDFWRMRNQKGDIGDTLYTKAQFHLALIGEGQSHGETALECTDEALKCYDLEQSYWVMPEQIHFQHSRALRVNGREDEADEYLQKAYERLMMVAGNIDDDELRRSYLENVRDNRAIQATYKKMFG